jgi:hypothetical protein
MFVEINEAIEIVLALARESIDGDNEKQIEACNTVEDFAVNNLGDD